MDAMYEYVRLSRMLRLTGFAGSEQFAAYAVERGRKNYRILQRYEYVTFKQATKENGCTQEEERRRFNDQIYCDGCSYPVSFAQESSRERL